MDHLRLSPNIDSDPDLMEVGWIGVRVFELLLKVSASRDLRGVIPPGYQKASWLARFWNLTPEDLGGGAPETFIELGVKRLMNVGGWITVDVAGGWVLRAWDKFYSPPKTAAERQAAKRERDRLAAERRAEERTKGERVAESLRASHDVTTVTPPRDSRDSHATPPPPHSTSPNLTSLPPPPEVPPPAADGGGGDPPRFPFTADGAWDFVQHERELRGLEREKKRPRNWEAFYPRSVEKFGPDALSLALGRYLDDEYFQEKCWPTAVFITDGVFEPRAAGPPRRQRSSL